MDNWLKWCREYEIFLIMLLVMDLFTGGFLWLMDARAFGVLFFLFVGISLLLFVTGISLSIRKKRKQVKHLQELLMNNSDDIVVDYNTLPDELGQLYEDVYQRIMQLSAQQMEAVRAQKEYEDYIEGWAHEIKMPLSLMTLVLENRYNDMTPAVYTKMNYIDHKMQDYVTQILYYARLKAAHKDYVMEPVTLCDFCGELLEEYADYTTENAIRLRNLVGTEQVYTDRKGLHFMLGQILNNACKYADPHKEESYIEISSHNEKDRIWLQVKDNGVGAKEYELPFLFDKGFTGKTITDAGKATGIGLYLVSRMANDLSLLLEVEAVSGKGFTIRIGFPVISR